MKHATTTPVDPVDPHAQRAERVIIGNDVSPAARPTHADRRWVLAEDQASSSALSQFIDEPALERLDFEEVDMAQKIGLQRGGVGTWLHQDSVPRSRRTRSTVMARSAHIEPSQSTLTDGRLASAERCPWSDQRMRTEGMSNRGMESSPKAGAQYWSLLMISPLLTVPRARHVCPSTEFLMKWTLPSPKSALVPKGW